MFELIGYLGSALIVVSLTRKSILKLRMFGLAGALAFFVYGLLIAAYPIAAVNIVIAGIHIYFLTKITRRPAEVFSILRVDGDSAYLHRFLEFHGADIRRYQPEYEFVRDPQRFSAFVLRDLVPAGVVIGRVHDDATVEIVLDYAIADYRDFRLGRYVYSAASGLFTATGCNEAWAIPSTEAHRAYLAKMGFRSSGDKMVIDLDQIRGVGTRQRGSAVTDP